MIDLRYKPKWLPQISAPFTYVLNKLNDDGIGYRKIKLPASEFKPLQGLVSLEKISDIADDNIQPSWCANDNSVLDGHHRLGKAIAKQKPFTAFQVNLNVKDAARVLNKIQDIWEYENQTGIEEVVAQDQINAMNEPDSGVSTSEFLAALESEMMGDDDDRGYLHDDSVINTKKRKIKAYRKKPITEKSKVGNFFALKPDNGYKAYDIEFDNLLDTDDMKISFHREPNPVAVLARYWFPNVDFKKVGEKYGVAPESIMNRAISEKARQMGYDGIKYSDIMVQGLD